MRLQISMKLKMLSSFLLVIKMDIATALAGKKETFGMSVHFLFIGVIICFTPHTEDSRDGEHILEYEAEDRAQVINDHELFERGAARAGARHAARSAHVADCAGIVVVIVA